MSVKNTWLWLLVAGGLFAFIYFLHPYAQRPPAGPTPILPLLRPATVTSIQIRPAGQLQPQIIAERTNGTWQLVEPLAYAARSESIDALLEKLAELSAATYITPAEIRARPHADDDYGFTAPQASLIIAQGDYRAQILIGNRTPPGDQVFLQLVSSPGAYIVDAELLKLLPRNANDWRDPQVIHFEDLAFDRVAVTNLAKDPARAGGASFVLQRNGTNGLWRMVAPWNARADSARIEQSLDKLHQLRVQEFIADGAKVDPEAFGLAPPELELVLAQGTNVVGLLQVGRSPTNDTNAVYARCPGQNAVFTIPKQPLASWQRASINDFREPHLLTLTEPLQIIEVHGQDTFTLERQTNDTWRIMPDGWPADQALVENLVSTLTNLAIVQFAKDFVIEPDLPEFGLAAPAREIILRVAATNAAGMAANLSIADLRFGLGTNQPDRVFARRTDESSVYAVSTNDYARLPMAGWQMRDRRLFRFTTNDIAQVTLQQQGRQRPLVRRGPNKWSLVSGSGVVDDLAVEETVRGLTQSSMIAWAGCGATNRVRCGFDDKCYQITFELKSGEKVSVQFGSQAASGHRYAGLILDGEFWIGEFPEDLYGQIAYSLTVP